MEDVFFFFYRKLKLKLKGKRNALCHGVYYYGDRVVFRSLFTISFLSLFWLLLHAFVWRSVWHCGFFIITIIIIVI